MGDVHDHVEEHLSFDPPEAPILIAFVHTINFRLEFF